MDKIQKTICLEDIKSRIPALFAYIEENDVGEFRLHPAMDSMQGCYGKIVENVTLPKDKSIGLTIKAEDETFLELLKPGETYSYRTIMRYYYEYRNHEFVEGEMSSIIPFVDRAIGKIEIDVDTDFPGCDLVPHYIYLSTTKRLLDKYSKLKLIYDYYTGGDDTFNINGLEGDICCKCLTYRRMGGTKMYNKINSELLPLANTISEEYYKYVASICKKDEEDTEGEEEETEVTTGTEGEETPTNTEEEENCENGVYNRLTLPINVNLKQSINDLGYLSCYLNNWVGGDKHINGELYTYNGNTYMCMEDNTDYFNEKTMRFEFVERVEDDVYFKKITEIETWPWSEDSKRDEVISYLNPYGNKFPYYDQEDKITDYPIDIELPDGTRKNPSSDSKLKSLRRFTQYLNVNGFEEYPDNNEDWLYYYKKGAVVNFISKNDELGNLLLFTDDTFSNVMTFEEYAKSHEIVKEEVMDNLCAYGDLITDITADKDQRKITFEYVFNAHLKATLKDIILDDDGNKLYVFDEFVIDDKDEVQKYYIKFTETYNYEQGGELDELVNDEEDPEAFSKYITSNNAGDYNKYAFNLADATVYYNKRTPSQIVTIPYLNAEYEVTVRNETDYMYCDLFKDDYLNGISYKPHVENNVRIDRGNYSAFERHIRLSEIKTMEDMENFSNGSFFNVQKVS